MICQTKNPNTHLLRCEGHCYKRLTLPPTRYSRCKRVSRYALLTLLPSRVFEEFASRFSRDGVCILDFHAFTDDKLSLEVRSTSLCSGKLEHHSLFAFRTDQYPTPLRLTTRRVV